VNNEHPQRRVTVWLSS